MKGTVAAHYAEYYSLRGAVAVLRRMSFQRAGDIGEWIGRLGYSPFRIRRAVVERQVRAAFPGLADSEVDRIAKACYKNLGRTTIESALVSSYSREELMGLFENVIGWDILERARSAGNPVFIVSAHLGNWELGGSYFAAAGFPIEAVARRMQNPLFDQYLTENRGRLGVTIIHDADAVRRVPRAVREGHLVGFLIDQGAVGLASTWVPFFGRYAKTPRGPAVFALRLKATIVFAVATRGASGRFTLHMEEIPVQRTGDLDTDVDAIVAGYTSTLERYVRRYPEQYFWHHRRWKHQRPGTPPELGDPS